MCVILMNVIDHTTHHTTPQHPITLIYHRYEEEGCTETGDGTVCEWAAFESTCVEKGKERICENFYDGERCAEHDYCEWLDGSKVCHRKALVLGCHRLTVEGECLTNGHCKWVADRHACTDPAIPRPCDWSSDKVSCGEADNCEWDSDAVVCKRKGMKLACDRYSEEEKCDYIDGCKWHTFGCFQEALVIPCTDIVSERHCFKIGCEWKDDKTCGDPDHGELHRSDPNHPDYDPAAPHSDTDPSLTSHLDGVVPDGAADDAWNKLHNDGNGPGGSMEAPEEHPPDCSDVQCENEPTADSCGPNEELVKPVYECCKRCGYANKTCGTYYEKEQCPAKCSWHSKFYYCGGLGEVIPCDKIYDESGCTNEEVRKGQCDWHESVFACVNAGEQPSCERYYEEESCNKQSDRCNWLSDNHLCWERGKALACDRHYSRKACEDAEGCNFDAHASSCHAYSDELHCDRYYTEDGCTQPSAQDRCLWFGHSSRCFEKNQKIPCEVHGGETCGDADGCGWDKSRERCVKVFDFHPLPCHEHWDEHTCTEESGCSWAASANACYKDGENIACDKYYAEEGCIMEPGCAWSIDATRCHPEDEVLTCESFYSDITCGNQGDLCEWDADAFHCLDKGSKVPCDKFYEQDSCQRQGCNWNAQLFACHGHDEALPCDRYYDKKWCVEQEHCKFEAQRCIALDHVIPCNEHIDQGGCEAAGCHFHHAAGEIGGSSTGIVDKSHAAGMCGFEHQPICDFLYDELRCTPETTNDLCGWDARLHKCRLLLQNKDEL